MKTKENKELTKAEEQVMQAVWKVGNGFANEIVAAVNEQKRAGKNAEEGEVAYNTVLTVVRILEQKGYVSHVTFNRSNRYYPTISREEYMQQMLGRMTSNWFGASPRALVSFLLDKKAVTLEDLEQLTKAIDDDNHKDEIQ